MQHDQSDKKSMGDYMHDGMESVKNKAKDAKDSIAHAVTPQSQDNRQSRTDDMQSKMSEEYNKAKEGMHHVHEKVQSAKGKEKLTLDSIADNANQSKTGPNSGTTDTGNSDSSDNPADKEHPTASEKRFNVSKRISMNSDKQPAGNDSKQLPREDIPNQTQEIKSNQSNSSISSDPKQVKQDPGLNQDYGSKVNKGLKAALDKTESTASSIVHIINPLSYMPKSEQEHKMEPHGNLPMDTTLNQDTKYSGTTFEDARNQKEEGESTKSTIGSITSTLNYLPDMKSHAHEQSTEKTDNNSLSKEADPNRNLNNENEQTVYKTLKEKAGETAQNIKEGYQSAKGYVGSMFDSAKERTNDKINKINENYQAAKEKTGQVAGDVKDQVKEGYDQSKEKSNEIADDAKTQLSEGYDKTKEKASDISQQVKNETSDAVGEAKEKAIHSSDAINDSSPNISPSDLKRSDSGKVMQDAKEVSGKGTLF
ncbi:hypothetical protein HK103_006953 [Boothiomyces macroporosus]|uniref:Uncharacterized protein n=1 Tax=Boothiomyces macroporosus TaxID=261099 RepID=A0AAD5UNP4_9FUNG|nr:hypothetical protein HK103_006953 [Boothiomyces macroporosus]